MVDRKGGTKLSMSQVDLDVYLHLDSEEAVLKSSKTLRHLKEEDFDCSIE
jgi:hypothetical protein